MFLQLLGVSSVFLGIQQTRKLFGRPTLAFMLRQWFRRYPRFRPHTFEARGTAVNPMPTASGRGHVFTATNPDAPLEQRIEQLEKNVEHLRTRIDVARQELGQEVRKLTNSLDEEQSTRAAEDQKVLSKLEATETGGLHISAMGAAWIFLGVILSSLPNELSKFFG